MAVGFGYFVHFHELLEMWRSFFSSVQLLDLGGRDLGGTHVDLWWDRVDSTLHPNSLDQLQVHIKVS